MDSKIELMIFALFTFLFFNISFAGAVSIGTAPGVLDLGEVQRGAEIPVSFYLITNSPNDMLVGFSPINAHLNIFKKEHHGTYTFIPDEASQEDISSWITFPENPMLVSPRETFEIRFADGSVSKVNRKVFIS